MFDLNNCCLVVFDLNGAIAVNVGRFSSANLSFLKSQTTIKTIKRTVSTTVVQIKSETCQLDKSESAPSMPQSLYPVSKCIELNLVAFCRHLGMIFTSCSRHVEAETAPFTYYLNFEINRKCFNSNRAHPHIRLQRDFLNNLQVNYQ